MTTKQKISSEAQWKSLVYDYLTNGNRGKSNFYELLRTNYKCEKSNNLMYNGCRAAKNTTILLTKG